MKNVTIRNVSKLFGKVKAVDDVSFEVKPGELLTLLGPSGCGKTTTLRLIAGLEKADAGEIYLGDRLVSAPARGVYVAPEKRGMGMVFQTYAVWPHMTVYENVSYPLKVKRFPRKEVRERVMATLETLGLGGLHDRPAPLLSGGQQQRVALGRALVFNPDVLLLDEPLANLDARLREEMRFELKDIQRKVGVTAIFVTHDQAEAMALSDRIAVMNHGKVEQMAVPQDIWEKPHSQFVTDFVGRVNHVPARVAKVHEQGALLKIDGTEACLRCLSNLDLKEGDAVLVSIRPHAMHIHSNVPTGEDNEPNIWSCTVQRSAFFGDHLDYQLDLGQCHSLRLEASPRDRFEDGQRVWVEIDPSAIFLTKEKAQGGDEKGRL